MAGVEFHHIRKVQHTEHGKAGEGRCCQHELAEKCVFLILLTEAISFTATSLAIESQKKILVVPMME